ncbi:MULTISPECIES: SapC family protein [Methylobacteriaceae]|uniref:SapC family protein n=1 Tax=Methylobacteriaceae TaxID=119045 RepID=UPI00074F86D8|nr:MULTISPECIES: SapC family protein [Methylobacteriaceae]AMB45562.1 multidrug transporter [Methylobacterium sp. AMS5]TFZ61136.1 multidrug transporter [Methylorubrum sp. Q1]
MSKQLLIYERAVPVTRQRHGSWSVKAGASFDFARGVNSVPLMVAEFPNSAAEYAIVFGGAADEIIPVALLGIRDNENLYVSESGSWSGSYVPAFLRRYPFVFSSDNANDADATFTLCVDEDFSGCNDEGRGERLFDADGERTQYLQNVLGFLQAYQVQFQRTKLFVKRLQEFGLLEPMQAQFTLRSGQRSTLSGFSVVSRDRLKALSAEQLAELMQADEMELIYLHLASLRNLAPIAERIGAPAETAQADETAPASPADFETSGNA